jgi:hypothetical protein
MAHHVIQHPGRDFSAMASSRIKTYRLRIELYDYSSDVFEGEA